MPTQQTKLKTISARVICDSVSPAGVRLTTMEVTMHRFILAEVNTHRAFSRNSASSRAIPIKKRIEEVRYNPAMPIYWGKNQSGMSAGSELSGDNLFLSRQYWLAARDFAVYSAERLEEQELHKQLTNRLLEPFLWHTAIISATEWDNFFAQRDHPAAQPELQSLAVCMRDAFNGSAPVPLQEGEWHTPYISLTECLDHGPETIRHISVARCARVSYLTHWGTRDVDEDLKLYDKLLAANPPHLSPFEHVATPGDGTGNFIGWNQLRHMLK